MSIRGIFFGWFLLVLPSLSLMASDFELRRPVNIPPFNLRTNCLSVIREMGRFVEQKETHPRSQKIFVTRVPLRGLEELVLLSTHSSKLIAGTKTYAPEDSTIEKILRAYNHDVGPGDPPEGHGFAEISTHPDSRFFYSHERPNSIEYLWRESGFETFVTFIDALRDFNHLIEYQDKPGDTIDAIHFWKTLDHFKKPRQNWLKIFDRVLKNVPKASLPEFLKRTEQFAYELFLIHWTRLQSADLFLAFERAAKDLKLSELISKIKEDYLIESPVRPRYQDLLRLFGVSSLRDGPSLDLHISEFLVGLPGNRSLRKYHENLAEGPTHFLDFPMNFHSRLAILPNGKLYRFLEGDFYLQEFHGNASEQVDQNDGSDFSFENVLRASREETSGISRHFFVGDEPSLHFEAPFGYSFDLWAADLTDANLSRIPVAKVSISLKDNASAPLILRFEKLNNSKQPEDSDALFEVITAFTRVMFNANTGVKLVVD